MNHSQLSQLIEQKLKQGVLGKVFPGAVALFGTTDGKILFHQATGAFKPEGRPIEKSSVFDLASITKACASSILSMRAVEKNLLDLHAAVSHYLPAFGEDNGRNEVKVWHLLTHVSGLPWWYPFFEKYQTIKEDENDTPDQVSSFQEAKEDIILRAANTPLQQAPETKSVYSDLNFILLGGILEKVFQNPLDKIFQEEVANTLKIQAHFRPRGQKFSLAVPTEYCSIRNRVVQGMVHDENAWAMGGVAGHAGLFGRAIDLFHIACALQNETFVSKNILQMFWPSSPPGKGTFLLGWDTPSPNGSSAGQRFSSQSVGHLGFTGTSLWIDREKQFVSILLTNRVYFGRANTKITLFRRQYHNLLGELLGWPMIREE